MAAIGEVGRAALMEAEMAANLDLEWEKGRDKLSEPLRKLLEARTKLADLRNKVAGNEKLEDLLNDVLANTEQLKQLGQKDPAGQE